MKFKLENPNLSENKECLLSKVKYVSTEVFENLNQETGNKEYVVKPYEKELHFKTEKLIPKTGVMFVGWGGNNGTTFTGIVLANKNKLSWKTKKGLVDSNYYGSVLKSSTVSLGVLPDPDETGTVREFCVPLGDLIPTLDPNEIEIDGWDISSVKIDDAMERAQVFEVALQDQLKPLMKDMKPRKSIFNVEFVASNQSERADNCLTGTWEEQVEVIRKDIREFKKEKNLDKVIVMWTASTERFTDIVAGVNDTMENLIKTMKKNNQDDIAPSTLFGIASVLEKCDYINGSPQNSLVPGLVELANQHKVHLAGDDFKTGQTKIKSALVEFLVNSGIKPVSIVSYNHLGNNDGKNLSAAKQFRSKEITKSGVTDDMVSSNSVLYKPNEKPDHCIVIKYVPYVGDSKRAMDEYTSEICMHGINTIVLHNTCEDSLLAATVMLDLVILAEVLSRIHVKKSSDPEFKEFGTIFSALAFLLKSPTTSDGEPSVNAFSRQRNCIENLFRACLGMSPQNHMFLEYKVPHLME